jgi:hypothetical protein
MNADIATAVRERPQRRRSLASKPRRSGGLPWRRASAAAVALACALLALVLAVQHPLGAVPAVLGVVLVSVLARYFWTVWPGWMLALVPLIGFAPWTGWLWIEEWHLVLLASAAGGYAAIAGPHRQRPLPSQAIWRRTLRWHPFTALLMLLAALAMAMAVAHGVLDGGGLNLSLYQGYHDSGQALRAGAPLLALALMLPLWTRTARRAPQAVGPAVTAGMLGVLVVSALGLLYERSAFTGLADFSTGYRSTSLFWEMHVGGAALNGALALSLPFALLALLRAERRGPSAAALGLALLGAYALITTFSGGLYLGALLGLLLTLGLWVRQRLQERVDRPPLPPTLPDGPRPGSALPALALLVLLGTAVAWQMFPSSGTRGLLAVCGALVALLLQPGATASTGRRQRVISGLLGAVMALPLVGLGALAALHIDKAAYVAYALCWLLCLALSRLAWQGRAPWNTALGDSVRAAAWLGTVGLTGVVAWSWGGGAGRDQAILPLAVLALAWPLTQSGTIGATLAAVSWRPRLWALGGLAMAASVVAALGGSAPISGGAATPEQDLSGRLSHWQRVPAMVAMVDGELIGAGAGRFVAHYAMDAPLNERTGDIRFQTVPEPHMALVAGRHAQGFGELLRLSQRLGSAPAGLVLGLQVRNPRPVRLHAEVCERHLIDVGSCITRSVALDASHDLRPVRIELGGQGELGGSGWPRRGLVFSLALQSPGLKADVAQLSLQGSNGQELLRNGRLTDANAHWFFSSDHHHLPWHAQSVPLHWYFEQGGMGLALNLALFALALGRVCLGSGARHPLAPALAGALLGFFVAGLFDSLVDAARIAFLYGSVLLIALGLRATPPPASAQPPAAHA